MQRTAQQWLVYRLTGSALDTENLTNRPWMLRFIQCRNLGMGAFDSDRTCVRR